MSHLAIIGGGAWGSALCIALSHTFDNISLISTTFSEDIHTSRTHPVLGVPYPKSVSLTTDYNDITADTAVLIAVPSSAFEEVLQLLSTKSYRNIAWATKGLVKDKYLHTLFAEVFTNTPACVISGPSFASEVALGQPTALVVASTDTQTSEFWASRCTTACIKPYISNDVLGVEIGGSLKNVYAIAAGIISELGYQTNTLSALITRSLKEMMRFGIAMGASEQTFMGLSGLGDLILTCSSDTSRNRRFGKYIAQGMSTDDARNKVGATVEGLHTLKMVLNLAQKHDISVPICTQMHRVIAGSISAHDAITELLSRSITHE